MKWKLVAFATGHMPVMERGENMTREEAVIILDGFKNNPLFSDTHVQALDMAISALSEIKGEPIECARTLKKHCINTKDCKECFMWNECKYELSAPCDWDLPDGEKGGE